MIRGALPVTLAWLALHGAAAARPAPPPATAGQADFFERRVRPVLAEHCHSCHGPKKQMSALRLDSRAALLEGGDGGPVVVPGEPERSTLLKAVRHEGGLKMPPRGKLPAQAVEDLAAWVKMGAPWPADGPKVAATKADDAWKKHWAFRPVSDPHVPAVKAAGWARTPVDRFILARLEGKGLTPSAEADRRTLIRRTTFDLIGLPPTPEEVESFVNDRGPGAYEKVIDRLLSSPHYGERWGRHWLDVARYADTKGYVFFEEANYPWGWTYRDYVIRSLNEDKPYDRFVLEQLAADRLPLGEDRRPLTALGFLTVGGRFMNNQHDILDDRIDVVTRGLMGLTVTCARCHDHKFDPIPSRDYYSLYGVFASCAEPTVPPLFEPPPKTEVYAKFEKELKARERKLTEFVKAKHDELTSGARKRVAEYLMAAHALRDQPSTEEFMLLADGNDLNPTMIVRWVKYLERTRKGHDPVFAPWHALEELPEKDFARESAAVLARLSVDPKRPVNPLLLKSLSQPPVKAMTDVAQRYATVLHAVEKKWQDGKGKSAKLDDEADEELWLVFHGPDAPPNVALLPYGDLSLLPDRPSQATLQKYRGALEQWRAAGPGAPPRANVLEDLPTPSQARVFLRGNPNNPGEAVPRQFLQVLAGEERKPFTDGSGRLELARAIIDPKNPLTARVMVNRVWMHHFGRGIVQTPGDFGLRSDPPSHPDLLDHLATWFIESGWSLKRLHRYIMLSAAYRQESLDRPEGKRADPENVLLWKMNRRRLDLEAMRDSLLAVAGRLDRKVGGPSVQGIFNPGAARRTLYGHLDRLNVPGLYRTFDFPSPDATSPMRDTTTVAPQALFLMNNPFVLDSARHLLRRADLPAAKDRPARVQRLYAILYGRPPTATETSLAVEYLGDGSAPAWERYVQALLLANEFAFTD